MPKSSNTGFTLVELLIVVVIIAVLSSIGFVSYSEFNKNARDVKRLSDLKFIQSALEQYYGDNFNYPQAITGDVCGDGTISNPVDDGCFLIKGSKTYVNELPKDPLSSNTQYQYTAVPSGCNNSADNLCTSYCLHAKVEQSRNVKTDFNCDNASYNLNIAPP